MSTMNEYEVRRLENIKKNQALIKELNLPTTRASNNTATRRTETREPASKKRKLSSINSVPTRTSVRISSAASRPTYNEDVLSRDTATSTSRPGPRTSTRTRTAPRRSALPSPSPPAATTTSVLPTADLDALRAGWTSWAPVAPAPTRDALTGAFHFPSHPTFTPNKSPPEMLREGCFGGAYFRPYRSRRLGLTVADDWRELPPGWLDGLDVATHVAGEGYRPETNKFGVACGQSIEEWEAAGWIEHRYDVRGWFQWYCRFFMGRRCQDDGRQVGRWERCVGERGRWRRMLLKKYVQMGVRDVFDDGEDVDEDGVAKEVSPVMHQTCHHWAFEVRQGVLDEYWSSVGR